MLTPTDQAATRGAHAADYLCYTCGRIHQLAPVYEQCSDAMITAVSDLLADALPEMLEESQCLLVGYIAGVLTAAEYILLDTLGCAPVVNGVIQPVPLDVVERLPDAAQTLAAAWAHGYCTTPAADSVQIAPDCAARILAAIENGGRP